MRKHLLLSLIISLCAMSAWAADVSVTERFSTAEQNTAAASATLVGDVCLWSSAYARHRIGDTYTNNNGEQTNSDIISYTEGGQTKKEYCVWMNGKADQIGSIQTTNLEGGIKSVSFRWAQFGAEDNDVILKLEVKVGSSLIDDYSTNNDLKYAVSGGANRTSGGISYSHNFNCTSNQQLYIKNVSTGTVNGNSTRRILIGNITITPYLLYTNKKCTLNMRTMPAVMTFTNADLINNTGATPTYTIIDYGTIPNNKVSINNLGQVTVNDVTQTGDITVQAKWEDVTTTYDLHIIGKSQSDAGFTESVVYKLVDDGLFKIEVSKVEGAPNASYSSSDGSVAAVDLATGEVTINGPGQATITATINETADYGGSTASYVLYVDESVTERFSNVPNVDTGSAPPTSSANGFDWKGDLCEWTVTYIRRGGNNSTDDHIDFDDQQMESCWLPKSSDSNYGKLETTNWEGGIKSVYFRWAQYGSEGGNRLALKVEAGTLVDDSLSNAEKLLRFKQDKNRESGGIEYMHSFEYKSNGQFSITNISQKGGNNNCRILVGDITIIPYIYYRTHKANIENGSNTYVNTDLINNTAGEGGTLTFSSANTDIATVNETTGVVTGVAVGCTEIIATYTWPGDAGEVTTRYQITVNQPITETFADASTLSDADMIETINEIHNAKGSLCEWEYYRVRRDESTDKLNSDIQGWWTSGSSATSGNFLRTKEALEGGVKALSFDWRQYGSAKGAHVQLQVTVGDESPVNMIDYSVATNGTNDETDKVAQKKDWNVKKNAQISFSNISTTTTDNKGRVIIGQIYVTPYIYYTKKSASVVIGSTYTNTGLINNTACEGGTLSYESSDASIATVNEGVVTGVRTGVVTITAKYTWDETHFVTTTYIIHVVESKTLVEDFSKIPGGSVSADGGAHSYVGNYGCTWWHRNTSYGGENYKLNDGKTKGFWLSHTLSKGSDNTSAYIETDRSPNYQEGGIKHVSFKWHQFGNATDQTIKLQIKVNNEVIEVIEEAGGDANADICVKDQTYDSNSDVVSKSNAKLTISNVSYVTGSDPKVDAQGRVIIGPISITPYLFYMQREAHVLIGERYTHPLLDNTEGEGTITYSIISGEDNASINSKTGEILAIASGNVTVKAKWSEGAYTTYTLHIAYSLEDEADNSGTIGSLNTPTVDIQLADRTIRTEGYNTLCLPFAVSEGQLKATLGEGVKAFEFTNAYLSATNLDIRFNKVPALEAGKPYLVTVPADVANPVFESVTIDESTTNNIIEGENMRFIGSFNQETMNETGLYIVANSLYRVENITSWDKTIGACRAYFDVPAGAPAVAQGIRMRIVEEEVATGVEEAGSETVNTVRSEKKLIDGQLIIIRDGKEYNAQGMRIR